MLPTIKKRLSSFVLEESGKISKSSLVRLSILSTVASTHLVISAKIAYGGCDGCGCGEGGGCGAGGCGCSGGGGADPCTSVSTGGGCG